MKWKFWEKELPKVEPEPKPEPEPKASFLLATCINPMGLVSVERLICCHSPLTYCTEIKVRSNDDPTKIGSWKHYVTYDQHESCIRKIQEDPTIKCIVV
jgi:hypothetical protein